MSKYLRFVLVPVMVFVFMLMTVGAGLPQIQQARASYADGILIKAANDPNIYIINNNLKVWVRSADVFNNCGYDWNAITHVASLDEVPTADLIKRADNPDVYRLEKNFKRKLASIGIFDSYNLDWNKIATVCPYILDSYPRALLMKVVGSDTIYKIAYQNPRHNYQTTRHRYVSMQAFSDDGKSVRDIVEVNQLELESYGTEGESIQPWAMFTPSTPYLFDPGLCVDTGSGFTISWTHPGGHLTFTLEQATNASFSDAIVVYSGADNDTVQTINASETTEYYYRVKASTKYDTESNWSNTVDMNVAVPFCD